MKTTGAEVNTFLVEDFVAAFRLDDLMLKTASVGFALR